MVVWGDGGTGAQCGGGGAAVLGRGRLARRAFAHGCVTAGVHVVFARSAHAVGCSMRASCSTNFLLHVGMCVVCVARRPFRSIAPPSYKIASATPNEIITRGNDHHGKDTCTPT